MIAEIEKLGLLDDEAIELDLAALTLSELDHEGVDLDPYRMLIAQIGERLAVVGAAASGPGQHGAALARVFAHDFGFAGDRETYDAPLNADLIRVLDRRRGLPVSLAILYVAAARRMGWKAEVLNVPGHVLMRLGERPFVVADPFDRGAPVSIGRLQALLHGALGPGVPLRPEHIAPMANRAVLVRLLLNQASRAEQGGDILRALTLYDRMTVVAPENPDGWWETARLQLQLQDIDAARRSLSAMLEITRDPERRRLVATTLEAIGAS